MNGLHHLWQWSRASSRVRDCVGFARQVACCCWGSGSGRITTLNPVRRASWAAARCSLLMLLLGGRFRSYYKPVPRASRAARCSLLICKLWRCAPRSGALFDSMYSSAAACSLLVGVCHSRLPVKLRVKFDCPHTKNQKNIFSIIHTRDSYVQLVSYTGPQGFQSEPQQHDTAPGSNANATQTAKETTTISLSHTPIATNTHASYGKHDPAVLVGRAHAPPMRSQIFATAQLRKGASLARGRCPTQP